MSGTSQQAATSPNTANRPPAPPPNGQTVASPSGDGDAKEIIIEMAPQSSTQPVVILDDVPAATEAEDIQRRVIEMAKEDAEEDDELEDDDFQILLGDPTMRRTYEKLAAQQIAEEKRAAAEAEAAEQRRIAEAAAEAERQKAQAAAEVERQKAQAAAEKRKKAQAAIERAMAKRNPITKPATMTTATTQAKNKSKHFWDNAEPHQQTLKALQPRFAELGFDAICSISNGEAIAAMRGAFLKHTSRVSTTLIQDGRLPDSALTAERREAMQAYIDDRESHLSFVNSLLEGIFDVSDPGNPAYHASQDVYKDTEFKILGSGLSWIMEPLGTPAKVTSTTLKNLAQKETPATAQQEAAIKLREEKNIFEASIRQSLSTYHPTDENSGLSADAINKMTRTLVKQFGKVKTAREAFRARSVNIRVSEIRAGKDVDTTTKVYSKLGGLTNEDLNLEAQAAIQTQKETGEEAAKKAAKKCAVVPVERSSKKRAPRPKKDKKDGKRKK